MTGATKITTPARNLPRRQPTVSSGGIALAHRELHGIDQA